MRWTWKSPDGNTRNEIDHLLTNNIRIIKNNTVLTDFSFSSDHRPVKVLVDLPIDAPIPKYGNNQSQFRNLAIPIYARGEARV